MPSGLKRYFGQRHAHYITCSCWHRLPFLRPPHRMDWFLSMLEETRCKYRFAVLGYVLMPEHFHFLISEPELGTVSTVMQVLKQRVSRRIRARSGRRRAEQMELWPGKAARPPRFWQPRSYDFNVWSYKKYVEKLRYLHRNPVTRGLVKRPEDWRWSSYRFFAYGEVGAVKIDYDLPDTPLEQMVLRQKGKAQGQRTTETVCRRRTARPLRRQSTPPQRTGHPL